MAAVNLSPGDIVLEIGPGLGFLTAGLAERAEKVFAFEIDAQLLPALRQALVGFDNVSIINEDFLKADLAGLAQGFAGQSFKVAANLPYYISTPVIMRLLEENHPVSQITVMVQKEVAARFMAKPNTKDYGALSLAVQYYADVRLIANVPRNSFIPKPNVDSAIIQLTIPKQSVNSTTMGDLADKDLLFDIIKAAFSMRRKTLLNCLTKALPICSKQEWLQILQNAGFDENTRGEMLSLENFIKLTKDVKLWDSPI